MNQHPGVARLDVHQLRHLADAELFEVPQPKGLGLLDRQPANARRTPSRVRLSAPASGGSAGEGLASSCSGPSDFLSLLIVAA